MTIKNEIVIRLWIVFLGVLCTMFVIFGKVFTVGILQQDQWKKANEELYVKSVKIDADRGDIIADDGSLLATSMPFYEIRVDMSSKTIDSANRKEKDVFVKNIDSLSWYLAHQVKPYKTTQFYKDYLTKMRRENNRHALLFDEVDHETFLRIKTFPIFRRGKNAGGLIAYKTSRRYRPFKELAFRTIGLNRKIADSIQSNIGLEKSYDHVLRGEEGEVKMQKIGPGMFIPIDNLASVKPKRGKDIVTTLNINFQDIAHNALIAGLKRHDAEFGTAIIMEVKSGAIKAMVNLGRDGNTYSEIMNYGIAYATEPGSTFKLASMIALLEDGYVKPDDSINLLKGNKIYSGGYLMQDAEKHDITWTTVQHAFEESSNVGISSLVHKYYGPGKNATKYVGWLKKLQLWKPTDIDLDGEANPKMKEAFDLKNGWSALSLPWMAIGYEIKLTPLQILNLYNMVANNGVMVKPHLVSEFQSVGETTDRFGTTVVADDLMSEKTLETIRGMLEGVVLRGTMKHRKSDKYNFAGKTGTSIFKYGQKGQKAQAYQSSFVGYFPAENPKYSCIVVVNSPRQNGYYGSVVAGPVFREIADKIFATSRELHKYMNDTLETKLIAKSTKPLRAVGNAGDIKVLAQNLGLRGTKKIKEGEVVQIVAKETECSIENKMVAKDKTPNVVGMGLRDAIFALEDRGLKVQVKGGGGRVVRQSVTPLTPVHGQQIELYLNR